MHLAIKIQNIAVLLLLSITTVYFSIGGLILSYGFLKGEFSLDYEILMVVIIYWASLYSVIKYGSLVIKFIKEKEFQFKDYTVSISIGIILTIIFIISVFMSSKITFAGKLINSIIISLPIISALEIFAYNNTP